MVDWRKIPKIDAHIHLTPKDVIDANIDYDGRFIVNGSIAVSYTHLTLPTSSRV